MRSLTLASVAILGLFLSTPAPAAAQLSGQIITSDQPLPDPSGSTADWVKDLKKVHKVTFEKDAGGGWMVHFIAFLKKAAGGTDVNLVFYDVTEKKPDQVHYVQYTVTPTQKTLKASCKLGPDDPVRAGRKYEVRLTRIVNNKEDVLAKVNLTFK
jgi:hypothetical protein